MRKKNSSNCPEKAKIGGIDYQKYNDESLRSKYPNIRDASLLEKSIRAFSLLESLKIAGCPFIFKGGTALMLHLDRSRRLSIDVDIVCPPGLNIRESGQECCGIRLYRCPLQPRNGLCTYSPEHRGSAPK